MGVSNSKNIDIENEKYLNLYKNELVELSNIINEIIKNETGEVEFRNYKYNFLKDDVCNNFALVFKQNLNELPMIQLKELSSDLLLVPNYKEYLKIGKNTREKEELCTRISQHYVKILNLLNSIYSVLGLKNKGYNNFCNIALTSLMMPTTKGVAVKYCKDTQENVNLSELSGINEFIRLIVETDNDNPEKKIEAFLNDIKSRLSPRKIEDENYIGGDPNYNRGRGPPNRGPPNRGPPNRGSYNRGSYDDSSKINIDKLAFDRKRELQDIISRGDRASNHRIAKEYYNSTALNIVRQKMIKDIANKPKIEANNLRTIEALNKLPSSSSSSSSNRIEERSYSGSYSGLGLHSKKITILKKYMPIIGNHCNNPGLTEISNEDWVTIFNNYRTSYEDFKNNYKNNINDLKLIVEKLYFKKNNEYILKILNEETLIDLTNHAKHIIHNFYTSCITKYMESMQKLNEILVQKKQKEQELSLNKEIVLRGGVEKKIRKVKKNKNNIDYKRIIF
jgi:hypothetical protein